MVLECRLGEIRLDDLAGDRYRVVFKEVKLPCGGIEDVVGYVEPLWIGLDGLSTDGHGARWGRCNTAKPVSETSTQVIDWNWTDPTSKPSQRKLLAAE